MKTPTSVLAGRPLCSGPEHRRAERLGPTAGEALTFWSHSLQKRLCGFPSSPGRDVLDFQTHHLLPGLGRDSLFTVHNPGGSSAISTVLVCVSAMTEDVEYLSVHLTFSVVSKHLTHFLVDIHFLMLCFQSPF